MTKGSEIIDMEMIGRGPGGLVVAFAAIPPLRCRETITTPPWKERVFFLEFCNLKQTTQYRIC